MGYLVRHKHKSLLGLMSLIAVVCTTLLLSSCNYYRNVRLLTGGKPDRSVFSDSTAFRYTKSLIVVDAKVNENPNRLQFIFDTGAFNSKIEAGVSQSMNLKTFATKDNSTAQGNSQEIEVTRLDRVQIGESVFKNIGAGKLTYAENSASPCVAQHGIIGANLIKLAHWKIDYSRQMLYFSNSAFEPVSTESIELPFKRPLLSGTPEISLQVGGRTVEGVLFDVGYNGGLILPSRFASHFDSDEEHVVYDQSTSGIYGTAVDTLITKTLPVSIGSFSTTIPVEFSSIGKALLGNDFLEHFEVVIDYKKKRIYLSPKEAVQIDESLKFIPGMLNDSLWVVNRTWPDAPFQLGDTLTSINQKKPADVFENHCDYVMNIQALYTEQPMVVELTSGAQVEIN